MAWQLLELRLGCAVPEPAWGSCRQSGVSRQLGGLSYSHMYELALRHGEPQWRAALFPLSVDGMIVGASMTLLSDARHGRRGGQLPWALLILGSVVSLAANVAVADPTMWSRIIHAWPLFALIGAYELLMREFRNTAKSVRTASADDERDLQGVVLSSRADLHLVDASGQKKVPKQHTPFQARAWVWAEAGEQERGELPGGKKMGEHFDRKERWGRLVKERGLYERRSSQAGGRRKIARNSQVTSAQVRKRDSEAALS
ncbi:DUF2637 domain-containing protein [Nocardiopsis alba]|uniref:DUF2637 domain-containing protein n=2 Tax=Nocardiopsis alba TaxID=53437 RepID=A0A7K2INJ0_9ACTN|nr:DUF2637 domain-containing protein [Nocardiopsis alba]MYR31407.1 DUF2637 domain-containing protein [Nocardiopsis alba]